MLHPISLPTPWAHPTHCPTIYSALFLALVTAALLMSGCTDETVVSPEIARTDVQAFSAEVASASKADRSTEPVYSFANPFGDSFGNSTLVRTPNGVNYRLQTTGLTSGHAYTLWIVIFNEPENCTSPTPFTMCSDPDVANDAAKPDMMYAAGRIVGASGKTTFAGRRIAGDDSGSINDPVGFPAYGLLNPSGAEIHLVVHDHGPKMAAYLPDMIQTVAGGCFDAGIPAPGVASPFNDYEGPEFGRRGPNTCQSIQFAAHAS